MKKRNFFDKNIIVKINQKQKYKNKNKNEIFS